MGPQLKADLTVADPIEPGGRFLPAREVWERYGVTSMSLYRWLADPEMDFPVPTYFGRFRYWRLSELLAWEATRPRRLTPSVTARRASAGTGAGSDVRGGKREGPEAT
jgi:predicted DNA-binding transcriptional regulator AlpA